MTHMPQPVPTSQPTWQPFFPSNPQPFFPINPNTTAPYPLTSWHCGICGRDIPSNESHTHQITFTTGTP